MTGTERAVAGLTEAWIRARREEVERVLDRELRPESAVPSSLHSAMRYAVMGGGKRIRPILAIAACEVLGQDPEPRMRAFAALELIHTYSLVHDDLPALDDDTLRRGRETTHVVFGEAAAILTGDALLTEAFRWLAAPVSGVDSERQLRAVRLVADAIDSAGMIGGQVLDLESVNASEMSEAAALDLLESIHLAKTGKLIVAAVLLGGVLGGANEGELEALRKYGEAIGLAFQIRDDILDEVGSTEQLGKTAGKDREQRKLTYPALLGIEGARERLANATENAYAAASELEQPDGPLHGLADLIASREN